jgi:hypothetical protein
MLQLKNEFAEAKRARAAGMQRVNLATTLLASNASKLQQSRAALERAQAARAAAEVTLERHEGSAKRQAEKQAEKQEIAMLIEQQRAEVLEAKRYPIDDYQLAQVLLLLASVDPR